jgi:hypothetical protein
MIKLQKHSVILTNEKFLELILLTLIKVCINLCTFLMVSTMIHENLKKNVQFHCPTSSTHKEMGWGIQNLYSQHVTAFEWAQ